MVVFSQGERNFPNVLTAKILANSTTHRQVGNDTRLQQRQNPVKFKCKIIICIVKYAEGTITRPTLKRIF